MSDTLREVLQELIKDWRHREARQAWYAQVHQTCADELEAALRTALATEPAKDAEPDFNGLYPTLKRAATDPEIPQPSEEKCWQESPTLGKCQLPRGHYGDHQRARAPNEAKK